MATFQAENPEYSSGLLTLILEYVTGDTWTYNTLMGEHNECDEHCKVGQTAPCGCTCTTDPFKWSDDKVSFFLLFFFSSRKRLPHAKLAGCFCRESSELGGRCSPRKRSLVEKLTHASKLRLPIFMESLEAKVYICRVDAHDQAEGKVAQGGSMCRVVTIAFACSKFAVPRGVAPTKCSFHSLHGGFVTERVEKEAIESNTLKYQPTGPVNQFPCSIFATVPSLPQVYNFMKKSMNAMSAKTDGGRYIDEDDSFTYPLGFKQVRFSSPGLFSKPPSKTKIDVIRAIGRCSSNQATLMSTEEPSQSGRLDRVGYTGKP